MPGILEIEPYRKKKCQGQKIKKQKTKPKIPHKIPSLMKTKQGDKIYFIKQKGKFSLDH